MALYSNKGDLITTYAMPTTDGGDGYGYDIAINPQKNVLLTSSFTGWNNYMTELGKLVANPEAMKRFGNTMVAWDLKAMKPKRVLAVPGAPLEIRWSLKDGDNWAITATALTSKLWLVKPDAAGEWQAKEVATIGDPAKIPLPVDISIRNDGTGLWVNTFMDGKTRYFDLTNPEQPQQTYEKVTGKQVNMISQSWDGTRVYISSSLLANWDKAGADNEQFVRGVQVGRQGADPDLRGRLLQGEAGPRAPHEVRHEGHQGRVPERAARQRAIGPRVPRLLRMSVRVVGAVLALTTASWGHGDEARDQPPPVKADFVPPAPGTYTLHPIMRAPRGTVVDLEGRSRPLAELTTGKITLLSFVYTRCADAWGCPLAYRVFDAVGDAIERSPTLRSRVRLVDPLLRPRARHADGDAAVCGRAGLAGRRVALPHHALGSRPRSPAPGLRAGRPGRVGGATGRARSAEPHPQGLPDRSPRRGAGDLQHRLPLPRGGARRHRNAPAGGRIPGRGAGEPRRRQADQPMTRVPGLSCPATT